jgi:hypothetical protein
VRRSTAPPTGGVTRPTRAGQEAPFSRRSGYRREAARTCRPARRRVRPTRVGQGRPSFCRTVRIRARICRRAYTAGPRVMCFVWWHLVVAAVAGARALPLALLCLRVIRPPHDVTEHSTTQARHGDTLRLRFFSMACSSLAAPAAPRDRASDSGGFRYNQTAQTWGEERKGLCSLRGPLVPIPARRRLKTVCQKKAHRSAGPGLVTIASLLGVGVNSRNGNFCTLSPVELRETAVEGSELRRRLRVALGGPVIWLALACGHAEL